MPNKIHLLLLSIFALLASIFIVVIANASIQSGSYFNLTLLSYEASQPLKGFISFGLSSENADSFVTASINGVEQSMPLLEFLENANANFTCQPTDCLSYYEAGGPAGQLVIMPDIELFGFEIPKRSGVTKIESLSFDISSIEDFQKTCGESPIIIDLLDDGTIDWQYLEAGEYCGNFSASECYKYAEGGDEFNIGRSAYCQKKFLQVTSRVKIGAMVKKREGITENGDLKMYIHDADTLKDSANCDLPEPYSNEFSLQSCELNFTVKKSKDYYICIIDEAAKGYPYAIRGEKSYPICGYSGVPEEGKEAVADFEIYTQIAEIAPFSGAVTFDEDEFKNASESFSESNSLLDYINDYLYEMYDYDCSAKCIIPIKAEVKGTTLIKPVTFDFISDGLSESIEVLNSLAKKSALIDMASTKLGLDALGFIAPQQHGNYTIILKIGSALLNPTSGIKFSVAAIPKIYGVSPLVVFAGFETTFSVSASSPVGNKIVKYNWNFGDGAVETTTNATVKHTYPKIGSYNLTIKAEDEKGIIGKATFVIEAEAPKEAVSIMLATKRSDLDFFSAQLTALPQWLQDIVKESYDIDELSLGLKKCEEDFKEATKDEKYVAIKEDLDRLLIPSKLVDSIIMEEMPTAIMKIDQIDPNYVKNLGGGSFESSLLSETKNAIASWQSENLDIKISGLVKTAKIDSTEEDIFTLLHLTLTPKKPLGKFYFVIVLPPGVDSSDVRFAEEYKEYSKKKIDGVLGFRFSELTASKGIDLALLGKQDFLLLNMFASPNLDELEIVELTACGNTICEPKLGENYKNCPEDCKPTKKVITYLLLVVLFSAGGIFLIWRFYAAIYDLMQQKKFFKTRKDYTDLLIFISSAIKKGQTEKEIRKKLVQAGWNKNQIEYAMFKTMKAREKLRKEQKKKAVE